MTTPRDRLMQTHKALNEEGLKIMLAKNHDYATEEDPYANFRAASALNMDPGMGLLLRVLDKIQRCRTYLQRGELKVPGESFRDAIVDVRNYMVLLAAMVEDDETPKEVEGYHPGDYRGPEPGRYSASAIDQKWRDSVEARQNATLEARQNDAP